MKEVQFPHLPKHTVVRKLSKINCTITLALCLFSWQSTAFESADELYETALISYQNQDIDSSIIHLKNALKQQKNHLAARILLAQAFLANGDGALAEIELNKANLYNADKNRLVTLFAHAYILQHKYDEVMRVTKPANRSQSIEIKLLEFRGQALIGQKLYRSADKVFASALEIAPNNQLALLGRAQIALNSSNPTLALELVERSLNNPAPFVNGWIFKSNVLSKLGQAAEAFAAIETALTIDNSHMAAQLTKAMLHIDRQEYALAEPHVDFILSKIPNEPRAGYLKAIINASLKNIDDELGNKKLSEVMATLSAVPKEIMKNTPDYYFLAGLTNFQYGNLDDAKRYLETYLTYVNMHLDSIDMIARINLQQGNTIAARNLLKKANIAHPKNPNVLTLLGMVYLQLNENKQAEYYFKEVLDISPNSEIGITNLARSKMQSGEYQSAVEALLSIKDNKVNSIQTKLLLIDSYEVGKTYDKAIKIAQELIATYPEDSYFQQRLGSLYGWNNQMVLARESFKKSLQLDTTNIAAVVHLARMDVIENNAKNALTLLQNKLQEFPENALLMAEISNVYIVNNNLKDALIWINKAHSRSPNNFYILSKLANALVSDKQLNKAIEYVDLFIGQNTNSPDPLRLIANLYQQKNQHQQAVLALREFVKKSNNKSNAYIVLAKAQIQAGDKTSAIQSYKKAIVDEQSSVPAHIGLVNLVIENKDETLALNLIRNLKQLTGSKSLEQVLLGELYFALNNISKAKKHYFNALEISDQKQAIIGLYRSFKKENQLNKAIPHLKAWLVKHPNDLAIEVSLADSYKQSGDLKQAAENYELLLNKHGELPILLNNIANIYYALNEKEKARVHALQAYNYVKDNVAIIDTYAWIESRLGNYEKALPLFRYALTKDYGNAAIKYHLAVTLDKLNRRAEAKGYLLESVDSHQHFHEKEQAKSLLATW